MSDPIKIGGISLTTTADELDEIYLDFESWFQSANDRVFDFYLLAPIHASSKLGHPNASIGAIINGILIGAELYRRRKEEADKAEVEAMVESVKGMTAEDA